MAKWRAWFGIALVVYLALTAWVQTQPLETSVVRPASPEAEPTAGEFGEPPSAQAVPVPGPQQQRKPSSTNPPRRELSNERPAALQTASPDMILSKKIELNARKYQLARARAVPRSHYDTSMGPLTGVQAGFAIVDSEAKGLVMGENERPVVVNPANNTLGIVSGTLIAVLHDLTTAETVATRHGLNVLVVDKNISAAFFKCPPGQDIAKAARRLAADPAVSSVETEVIFGHKVRR